LTGGYFYPIIESMSVIIILLAASISVAALFLGAFLWGVKSGQFEDDFSPASRILFDDKPKNSNPTNK
jgi:cbb3-type cytochrome oxidase maturation protein